VAVIRELPAKAGIFPRNAKTRKGTYEFYSENYRKQRGKDM
jgi:hypothetical protein